MNATAPATIPMEFCELTGTLEHDDDARQLILWGEDDGEVFTVNLQGYGLHAPSGHVYIKDWSELSGVAKSLEASGLVKLIEPVYVGRFDSRAFLAEVLF